MADATQQALPLTTDPEAWVERYGDYLYRFTLIRVRDPNLAEELVQETLVAALQARERFAGTSSERSWLTGILKHKIVDHFRRRSREQPVEDIEPWTDALREPFDDAGHWRMLEGVGPTEWGQDASQAVQQKEFQDVLQQCLAKLPARIAAAFTLREIEELKTREICKILAISPTNLWVMLHRARIQLRQCLELRWFGRTRADD